MASLNLEDWTPRQRPGLIPLIGRHVRLDPLDWEAHGHKLFAAVGGRQNAQLWRYMPVGPFPEYAQFRQTMEKSGSEQDWQTLVIQDAISGTVLGMASYMRIREAHGSAEIGAVAFGKRLQRTAQATEALMLMAAHVFNDLGYRRYEWKCNNANEASKRAAGRFGFVFEGVFRNDMVTKGENRDTAWFSIIDSEWPRASAALAAWLAPSNFDQDNRQIRKLEELRAQL